MRTLKLLASSAAALVACPVAAQLNPGDILLNHYSGSKIQRYNVAGVLQDTYTGTGMLYEGASITPDGNIVTTRRGPTSGINIFHPTGPEIASFNTPSLDSFPFDVSVFADGTLAICQNASLVHLYSQDGNSLGFVLAPFSFGSTVSPLDDTLWLAHLGGIGHYSRAGSLLGSFVTPFTPSDLVVDPTDGSLWIANRTDNAVVHMSADGATLGSFSIGQSGLFAGIGITSDGSRLYATTTTATTIGVFAPDGAVLGSINIVNPGEPLFLTVVPGTPTIVTSAPEPGAGALLLVGATCPFAAKRRRVKAIRCSGGRPRRRAR